VENLILGLLMLMQMTAYELHSHIKNNYEGIASPSLGNVQRALKQLEAKGLVTKQEVMSGKVTKKIFTITKDGRTQLMKWLSSPPDFGRANNLEMGKMLMMGMLTREQQLANLERVIADFREAATYLAVVEANMLNAFDHADQEGGIDYLQQMLYDQNPEFYAELLEVVNVDNFPQLMKNVNEFGYYTLQHGIAETKFNLEWFENLRKELAKKMEEHT